MKDTDSDQLDAMGDAAQAMLAADEGITDAARLQMGRALILPVEVVDLSALVRTIVVVGATTLWLTSWASGSVPVLMDKSSTSHAVTRSAGPAWCNWRGGCSRAP